MILRVESIGRRAGPAKTFGTQISWESCCERRCRRQYAWQSQSNHCLLACRQGILLKDSFRLHHNLQLLANKRERRLALFFPPFSGIQTPTGTTTELKQYGRRTSSWRQRPWRRPRPNDDERPGWRCWSSNGATATALLECTEYLQYAPSSFVFVIRGSKTLE